MWKEAILTYRITSWNNRENALRPPVSITGLRIEIRTWNLPICGLPNVAPFVQPLQRVWPGHQLLWAGERQTHVYVWRLSLHERCILKWLMCYTSAEAGDVELLLWACIPGCLFRISVGAFPFLAKDLCDFSQSHLENTGIISQMCLFIYFPIHNL
jgi:hypothetical protein